MEQKVNLVRADTTEEYDLGEIDFKNGKDHARCIYELKQRPTGKLERFSLKFRKIMPELSRYTLQIRRYSLPNGLVYFGVFGQEALSAGNAAFKTRGRSLIGMMDYLEEIKEYIEEPAMLYLEKLNKSGWHPDLIDRIKQLPQHVRSLVGL